MLRLLILICLILPIYAFGIEFTFNKGIAGWEGEFADYPVDEDHFYELSWGWENLPFPVDSLTKGLFLNGNNHSDDLFMFVKRRIDGLEPDTLYDLDFKVVIECDTPMNATGIGGAPGESLYFKVGASVEEPLKIALNDFYSLNVDKGNQSIGGECAQVIGDLANPAVDAANPQYQPKELSSTESLVVKSDSNGSFWIFLGTDSGFEGLTRFYIAKIVLQTHSKSSAEV